MVGPIRVTLKKFPKILFMLLFVIGGMPIIIMLVSSFVSDGHFSWGNYRILIDNPKNIILIKNSIQLGLLTVIIANLIGIPVAFILSKTNLILKNIIKIAFVIPILFPSYIVAISWGSILGKNGIVNSLFNIGDLTTSLYHSIFGAAFILAICYMPIVILLVSDSLNNIEKEIEEAALLEGSRINIFPRLTLPLIQPAIISSSILIFTLAISEFGVPMFLGVDVFISEIFTQFSAFYNYEAAIILSLPLTLLSFILIYWEYKKLKDTFFINTESIKNKSTEINLGKWNPAVFVMLILILFLLILLPLINLFIKSLPLNSYALALQYSEKPALVSLLNSLCGAILLTILGFITAYHVERKNNKFLDVQLLFYFAIPSTVLGIGLIQLWNRWILSDYVYSTFIIVQIGYIARFLIISERVFLNAFKQIPRSFEECAVVEGATQLQIFRKILIPILTPSIFISFILGFIFCFGELGTTILVYPPGQSTLPISFYTIMANSPERIYSAMSMLIIIPLLFIIIILFIVQKYFSKRLLGYNT